MCGYDERLREQYQPRIMRYKKRNRRPELNWMILQEARRVHQINGSMSRLARGATRIKLLIFQRLLYEHSRPTLQI